MHDFDPKQLIDAVPEGPIFLRGGGNFGDLWLGHQRFRERVIELFPDRQIIQLPQSIHFDSAAELERAAASVNSHRNFVLLVRDRQSEVLARKHFRCQVALCPDMAFFIGALTPLTTPKVSVLAMLRQDKEQAADKAPPPIDGKIPVQDWIDEPSLPVKVAKLIGTVRGLTGLSRQSVRRARYEAVARQRFHRGVYQLSRAEVVVTDRLHVHIVSLLLGLPHAVLDNSYGKIAGFREAFPEPPGLTYAATSLEDALAWASRQVQT